MGVKAMFSFILLLFTFATSSAMKESMLKHLDVGGPQLSMKSIVNKHGDIYDCVYKYKQPAFDHPALKDHEIKARPSKKFSETYGSKDKMIESTYFGFKRWCPRNYVPVQRISSHHSLNNPTFQNVPQSLSQYGNDEYGGIRTKPFEITRYHGVEANVKAQKPKLYGAHEYSSAVIAISNWSDESDQIAFGWTVDPDLNTDSSTHLFISWTNNGFKNGACYNLLCSGFVISGNMNPLGTTLSPVSSPRENVFASIKISILQDPHDQKWWASINDFAFGYWPNELFGPIQEGGTYVYLGGVTYTPPGEIHRPQMGSGKRLKKSKYERTCFMYGVRLSNSQFSLETPGDSSMDVVGDSCYTAEIYPHDSLFGYMFIFGGRGLCIRD